MFFVMMILCCLILVVGWGVRANQSMGDSEPRSRKVAAAILRFFEAGVLVSIFIALNSIPLYVFSTHNICQTSASETDLSGCGGLIIMPFAIVPAMALFSGFLGVACFFLARFWRKGTSWRQIDKVFTLYYFVPLMVSVLSEIIWFNPSLLG